MNLCSDTKEGDEFKLTKQVAIPKIFKAIEQHGFNFEIFDDDLYSLKYKHFLITKLIS